MPGEEVLARSYTLEIGSLPERAAGVWTPGTLTRLAPVLLTHDTIKLAIFPSLDQNEANTFDIFFPATCGEGCEELLHGRSIHDRVVEGET